MLRYIDTRDKIDHAIIKVFKKNITYLKLGKLQSCNASMVYAKSLLCWHKFSYKKEQLVSYLC